MTPGTSPPSVPAIYDQVLGPILFEPFAADLAQRGSQIQGPAVLEIAAGTGILSRHLLSTLSSGHLTCTDIDEDMLQYASSRLHDKRITWQLADSMALPFADQQFARVYCQFGIMFAADKAKAFGEVFRVLSPGGSFLFNVWDDVTFNLRSLQLQEAVNEVMQQSAPDFNERGPYSFPDPDKISGLLKEAGFTGIHFYTLHKSVFCPDPDELVRGFVDGSPLSAFLAKRNPSIRKRIKERFREKLGYRFDERGVDVPMQAILFEAGKGH